MSTEIPWAECITRYIMDPHSASIDEIARMAGELKDALLDIENRKEYESWLQGHDSQEPMRCYDWWLKNKCRMPKFP